MKRLAYILVSTALLAYPASTVRGTPIVWDTSAGGNGHMYEEILTIGLTWDEANSMANEMEHENLLGHLVKITSADEQDFLVSNLTLSGNRRFWLGGFQDTSATEYSEPAGAWKWGTG
jgi:hypothetical protein